MQNLKWLLPTCLFLILIGLTNCKSADPTQTSKQERINLQNQIESHVKFLNTGNAEKLELIYADDYEGISPVTRFDSKQELVALLVENQQMQNITIEIEIIEMYTSNEMAYAVLDWKAVTDAGKPGEQLLYTKKHLQIWEKNKKDWQLKRSLFFN